MARTFFDDWIMMKNQINQQHICRNATYTSPGFRTFLLSHVESSEQLDKIAQETCRHLFRHQQLLYSNSTYYVACDVSTRTRYICYKDIVMLDFDVGKSGFCSKDDILTYLKSDVIAKYPCIIHETCHGYHCFLLDERRQHNSFDTFMFLQSFRQDPNYSLYCYIRGFSVRLTRKRDDDTSRPLYRVVHGQRGTLQRDIQRDIGVMFKYMDESQETCLMK